MSIKQFIAIGVLLLSSTALAEVTLDPAGPCYNGNGSVNASYWEFRLVRTYIVAAGNGLHFGSDETVKRCFTTQAACQDVSHFYNSSANLPVGNPPQGGYYYVYSATACVNIR